MLCLILSLLLGAAFSVVGLGLVRKKKYLKVFKIFITSNLTTHKLNIDKNKK